MLPPKVEGRLLQVLGIGPEERVLEIGTGSGFLTWLLAQRAAHVTSIELKPGLAERARANLSAHGVGNAAVEVGDGRRGRERGAPYDAIAVGGSVPVPEPALEEQLAIGGRLFVVVGAAPAMEAMHVRRAAEREWIRESLFETVLPALEGSGSAEAVHPVNARVAGVARALAAGALLTAMSSPASADNLFDVFEAALASDPEYLASGADHRAAQEVRPQALAGLQPTARVSLDVRWNERQRSSGYRSDLLVLDITQPIHRLDRRIAVDQADSRIARADALYASARQDLMVRVAERYFRVLEAGRRARLRPGDPGGVRAAARTEPATLRGRAHRDHRRRGGQGGLRSLESPAHRREELARHRPGGAARDDRRVPGKARPTRGNAARDTPTGRHRQVDGDRARTQSAPARRPARLGDGPPGDRPHPGRPLAHARRRRLVRPA